MKNKDVKATIISTPTKVRFICPYCQKDIEVPFNDVYFNSNYWWDGAYVDCSECGDEVYLDNFECD